MPVSHEANGTVVDKTGKSYKGSVITGTVYVYVRIRKINKTICKCLWEDVKSITFDD